MRGSSSGRGGPVTVLDLAQRHAVARAVVRKVGSPRRKALSVTVLIRHVHRCDRSEESSDGGKGAAAVAVEPLQLAAQRSAVQQATHAHDRLVDHAARNNMTPPWERGC